MLETLKNSPLVARIKSTRAFKELRTSVHGLLDPALHKPEIKLPHKVYGSEYGGWPLLDGRIDARSVIYAFGVGQDITFDLAAIDAFGCAVHAFDPTPRCLSWIASQSTPPQFHFHPIGIAAEDGVAEFFAPAKDDGVSFSNAPGPAQAGVAVKADVRRLSSIMADLGHAQIDVLKLDIEGFEYAVLGEILASPVRPETILVEFHHGMYACTREETQGTVADLRAAGYKLFYVSPWGREYGFVRQAPV